MATKQLTAKDPEEVVLVTFEFSEILTTIDSVANVSIALKNGVDANVEDMLQGDPHFSGTKVMQLVKNGVNGASYTVRAEVNSGPEKFVLAAILPVNEA